MRREEIFKMKKNIQLNERDMMFVFLTKCTRSGQKFHIFKL